MAKAKPPNEKVASISIEEIKRTAILAVYSDDVLMRHLVVKGGNALDILYDIASRASIDVDFSMAGDIPGGAATLRDRMERSLEAAFRPLGLVAFDVTVDPAPEKVSEELSDFWGGYSVQFKLVKQSDFDRLRGDIEALRRAAIPLGKKTKFLMDVSKFEYVDQKVEIELHGVKVSAYSLPMMAAEKLRALCQHMQEYNAVIKRSYAPSARARDPVDIYLMSQQPGVDLFSDEFRALVSAVFAAKRVSLALLRGLANYREFHREDFASVLSIVKPGVVLKDFDFYYDFVLGVVQGLEPLGDE